MREIALTIPGQTEPIPGPPDFTFNSAANTGLGYVITQFVQVLFLVAGFLVFVWILIGIFQYIMAGGNKEGLAKARSRIQWALIGFIFLFISFALSQYVQQIFPINATTVTDVKLPK